MPRQKDPRYPDNWGSISIAAKQKHKTCCFCLLQPSKETHHTEYIDSSGVLLLNRVVVGVNIFPVCLSCHNLLHTKKYWNSYQDINQNCNKAFAKKNLQIGFSVLYSSKVPLWRKSNDQTQPI